METPCCRGSCSMLLTVVSLTTFSVVQAFRARAAVETAREDAEQARREAEQARQQADHEKRRAEMLLYANRLQQAARAWRPD